MVARLTTGTQATGGQVGEHLPDYLNSDTGVSQIYSYHFSGVELYTKVWWFEDMLISFWLMRSKKKLLKKGVA